MWGLTEQIGVRSVIVAFTLMTNLSRGLDALPHSNVPNVLPLDFGSVFSGSDPTHFCAATSVPPK